MPERRVDGISKSEPVTWAAGSQSGAPPSPLRVLSGHADKLPTEEPMSAVPKKGENGSFRVTLNGESLVIKGLPASLAGKQVDFVAKHQEGSSSPQLFWTGLSHHASTADKGVEILSRLPVWLKEGHAITARVESLHAGKMTLSLQHSRGESAQLIAAAHPHFKPGHIIQGRIFNHNGQPMLMTGREFRPGQPSVTTAPLAGHQLPQKMTPASGFTMNPGDSALALVEKRLENNLVQIRLHGQRMEAPAPRSVMPGDGMVVKMTAKPASFQLLAVQPDIIGKTMAVIRQHAASTSPAAESMTTVRHMVASLPPEILEQWPVAAQLANWFEGISVNQEMPLSGNRMASMIQHSGLLLEHKLQQSEGPDHPSSQLQHDFKAIMLNSATEETATTESKRKLAHTLVEVGKQASSRIEFTQALNVLAHLHADTIRLELPMLVQQQMVNVQLSIEQQWQQAEGGRQENEPLSPLFKVLIALEMSRLGKLRVDAHISEQAVHARIYNDTAAAGRFMQMHMERLEGRLRAAGFEEVYLISAAGRPAQELQQHFDQLEQMRPSALQLLDVVV
ncbi:flagellar hook-length control protein FliK [Mariprofundus erugo]|uniref:Flagellar hook-length control protein FliK n=1 Tax=Mariprofundus erugo TaxID=2528639 RepID=A0A5R9GG51_9PROT|nr:flagellar hook-length control protein FliK [Mariprofundus erugo]TLS65460.1 flagellar hook-length control protein FliK [Mariprofundus erugo]